MIKWFRRELCCSKYCIVIAKAHGKRLLEFEGTYMLVLGIQVTTKIGFKSQSVYV